MGERVGEVIESRTTELVAQCYRLHEPPALGSLVKVRSGSLDVLAIVSEAGTASVQPGRRPVARGMEESTEEDLHAHNPQLDKLFRTIFQAQIVGYAVGGDEAGAGEKVFQNLPPRPPQIHAFVYECDGGEAERFGHSLHFLGHLARATTPAADEMLVACLNLLSQSTSDPRRYLVRAGKELSLLLAGEPQRLNAILKGLRP